MLTTDIPVGEYTFAGDSLKIDFGYRGSDSKYHMMHAASVVTGLAQTAVFALSWPAIRNGIQQSLTSGCEMIAVIEDSRFNQSEQSRNAQKWMTDTGIELKPVSDLGRLAHQVRSDLKLS